MRISIIIPTLERPDSLLRCLNSILVQTRLPHEIVIIDDGNLGGLPLEQKIREKDIVGIYYKKRERGVAEFRRVGAKLATGDVLFFLEDDVELFPDFIEEVMKVYESPNYARVGGVGGAMATLERPYLKDLVLEIGGYVFLHRSRRPAKVLPSGFDTFDFYYRRFKKGDPYEVDYIAGGIGSFKKNVLEEFEFSNAFQDALGYGHGQDREFGYRVSRKYKLYINPKAKAYHFKGAKIGGEGYRKKGKEFVMSKYVFFKNHLSYRKGRWILFYYSLLGYLLLRTTIAAISGKKEELERVKGILDAIRIILKGKTK